MKCPLCHGREKKQQRSQFIRKPDLILILGQLWLRRPPLLQHLRGKGVCLWSTHLGLMGDRKQHPLCRI